MCRKSTEVLFTTTLVLKDVISDIMAVGGPKGVFWNRCDLLISKWCKFGPKLKFGQNPEHLNFGTF